MPIEVRSFSSAGNSGATATVPRPAGVVDGDFLLCFATTDLDTTPAVLTAPAGWTQTGPDSGTTGSFMRSRTFWKIASSEPESWTFGAASGSDGAWKVIAWTGVDAANPFVVAATYTTANSGTAITAPSVTPAVPGELVCGFSSQGAGSMSEPAGMSEIVDTSPSGWAVSSVCRQAVSAGATGTRIATHTVSNLRTGMSLVLRPAADTALVVEPGRATDAHVARPVSASKSATLPRAVGAEVANLLQATKSVATARAATAETARSFDVVQSLRVDLGRAEALEVARAVTVVSAASAGRAATIEVARVLFAFRSAARIAPNATVVTDNATARVVTGHPVAMVWTPDRAATVATGELPVADVDVEDYAASHDGDVIAIGAETPDFAADENTT